MRVPAEKVPPEKEPAGKDKQFDGSLLHHMDVEKKQKMLGIKVRLHRCDSL